MKMLDGERDVREVDVKSEGKSTGESVSVRVVRCVNAETAKAKM